MIRWRVSGRVTSVRAEARVDGAVRICCSCSRDAEAGRSRCGSCAASVREAVRRFRVAERMGGGAEELSARLELAWVAERMGGVEV